MTNAKPAKNVRITPLEPPYSPEVESILEKWMVPGSTTEPLKLFRVLAKNLKLVNRMRPTGSAVLGPSSLIPPADREILIDRTCANCNCEYEWGVHVTAFGALLGHKKALLTGGGSAGDSMWTDREKLLIKLADELHATAEVTEETWQNLALVYDEQQLIELVVIVGWYHLISFIANATGISLEDWAARFPQGVI